MVIANWKMNPVLEKDAEKLFKSVVKGVHALKNTEVVVCPPFIYFDKLSFRVHPRNPLNLNTR